MDADTKKLVKVGTDVKRLRAYTSAFQVPIQEFKKNNTDRIATLIAITKLDTSSTVVANDFDYNADKTISLGIIYSDNSNPYSFLRKTCEKCNDETFEQVFLKDVKLGNTTFDGYITGVRDNNGREMGHFFGVRRIGNLYLVCQFNFPGMETFDTYKEYFKSLKLN